MTEAVDRQIAELKKAIAALESTRSTLGEAAVEVALQPLREKLAELEPGAATSQRRKHVTVLLADVSGFTAMSEKLDAEEIGDLMNTLWQRLDAVITRHGGTIDKHLGDAVMALWGAETAREDDPERAIRAALEMQAEIGRWPLEVGGQAEPTGPPAGPRPFAEGGPPPALDLQIRIGIHSGPVLMGEVGTTREFTAMGDTVNLVSRLEHAAPVGGVLISHATYRHVRGVFDVQPREPLAVKGKAAPIQTYLVERAKPRAFRMPTRGVQGVETRMVGREAELAALQTAFRQAPAAACTQLVTITGEAGVGKSRLLDEFENWLELQPEAVYYFQGRAVPEMTRLPYSLWRDLFRLRFGILESDSAAVARQKFRDGMAGFLAADRADLVGHLVGFDFSASPAVRNLLGSPSFGQLATADLTNYLRAVAAESPTVVFLEDLHWADDASLDLIEHLARAIPQARLLVVNVSRPLLLERRPNWGAGWAGHRQVELGLLSEAAGRALVDEILQKVPVVPEELRRLIIRSAEGNPFYAEELIKMLIEDEVIVVAEDRWRVELAGLSGVRVPPTLTSVLQARLDALGAAERAVLQRAAVVGRLFWDRAVAALRAGEEPELDIPSALAGARKRELVYRREPAAFAGTAEYGFQHALLHDVVYETVLLKLRRVYHKQVAEWLEAHAGERLGEYLGLIAGHYERAGEKAWAADYLRRAGQELFKTSAFRGAAQYFERALALTPDEEAGRRARLLIGLGDSCRCLNEYAVAAQYLEQGLALARAMAEHLLAAEALNGLCLIAIRQSEYSRALESAQEALALARLVGDKAAEAVALRNLGYTAFHLGDYGEATRHSNASLVISQEIGDEHGKAITLLPIGNIACFQGDYGEARRCYEECWSISQRVGDRRVAATSLNNLGNLACMQEDYLAASSFHERSLALRREIGDLRDVAMSLNNLGTVSKKLGNYEQAGRLYEESLALERQIGNRLGLANTLNNLGHVAALAGRRDSAWSYFRQGLAEGWAIGALPIVQEGLVGMARLQCEQGHDELAAEWVGLILQHPATMEETRREEAEPLLTRLRQRLPAAQLAAALARGQALDLETVVTAILAQPDEAEPHR